MQAPKALSRTDSEILLPSKKTGEVYLFRRLSFQIDGLYYHARPKSQTVTLSLSASSESGQNVAFLPGPEVLKVARGNLDRGRNRTRKPIPNRHTDLPESGFTPGLGVKSRKNHPAIHRLKGLLIARYCPQTRRRISPRHPIQSPLRCEIKATSPEN